MKERQHGRIIFVSSQAGQLGLFGYTAYSASKYALRGLAEALQMEVSIWYHIPLLCLSLYVFFIAETIQRLRYCGFPP
jgi:short-subunit dehydrogenase